MIALRRFAALSLVVWLTTAASAQEPPQGFESLIAADDLQGWRGSLQDWVVQDGVLIGRADGSLKANRFIIAEIPPVRNFELRVDVWVSEQGNSGLQYRSQERPDLGPFVVTGYQCDVVARRADYNGMLYEERGRRILAHTGERVIVDADGQPWVVGKLAVGSFPAGQWHRYRVVVQGNHHRHWIDDVPTVDVIDLDEAGRRLEGVLGVQVHVGPPMEVRYRNFHLKRLPDDLPILSAADAPLPAEAVKVVPQGAAKAAGEAPKVKPAELGATNNVHQCGAIYLAGQPSPDDVAAIRRAGIKRVVTLRTEGELTWDERSTVTEADLQFDAIGFRDPADLTDEVFATTRRLLRSASQDNKVLLHCGSANRVGAVWLAFRALDQGLTLSAAIEEATRVGLRSEAYKEKAIEYVRRQQAP